jgi:proteasome lid subunit RPN8/RPN11
MLRADARASQSAAYRAAVARVCQRPGRLSSAGSSRFPRTGRNTYFIDPAELLAIERDRAAREEVIRVIYHSHCDADAYFSREDVRRALFEGEPVYPGAAYLIVSIRAEEMAGIKIFHWRRELRRFVSECGELARD